MNVTAIDRYYLLSDVTAHLSRNGYSFSFRTHEQVTGFRPSASARYNDMWVYSACGALSRSFIVSANGVYISRRDYDGWCKHVGIVPLTNEVIPDI